MIQVITLQFQSFFSIKFFNEFYDLEVIINDASKVFKPLLFFKKTLSKNPFYLSNLSIIYSDIVQTSLGQNHIVFITAYFCL